MLRKFSILIFALSFSACASRHEVAEDYRLAMGLNAKPTSQRTVILFLIDGLPLATLQQEFSAGHLPNLRGYFPKLYQARTTFPSLTYPAIGSLLSEKPIDKNGLYGNLVYHNGKVVDYSSINDFPELNAKIQDNNIFARLAAKGQRSVSFDYAFHSGATAHTGLADAKAGFSVADQDYAYVDLKTLASLTVLLKSTPPGLWPDFIFVHIVGVDFTSHDEGPDSAAVKDYLEKIDSKLGSVFAILNRAEKHRSILTMLTSDHGFDQKVVKVMKLEEAINETDRKIKILNEGRFLGLLFPASWSTAQRTALITAIAKNPEVDLVALQSENHIDIQSHNLASSLYFNNSPACGEQSFAINHTIAGPALASALPWSCVDQTDSATAAAYYPFFIPNVAHYFKTPGHPDAVIIPKPGVSFTTHYAGQHGGPTAQEVLVPLLMHGASLPEGSRVPALHELLNFM